MSTKYKKIEINQSYTVCDGCGTEATEEDLQQLKYSDATTYSFYKIDLCGECVRSLYRKLTTGSLNLGATK